MDCETPFRRITSPKPTIRVTGEEFEGKFVGNVHPTSLKHEAFSAERRVRHNAEDLLAEGARFELADPLRGLRFSRPARSAAPSPLQTELVRPGALNIKRERIILHISLLSTLAPSGAYQPLVDPRVHYRRIANWHPQRNTSSVFLFNSFGSY